MAILAPGKRVVLIGDSHMEALGPRLQRRLPLVSGVQVQQVVPRRGWSARRYVREGGIRALTRGADVVVIELGGNDASANITPARHEQDIVTLMAQAAPAKVIWVGPGVTLRPDLEEARAPLRETQRRVVPAQGGAWIDAQPMTRESDLRSDRVHFSAGGYTRWADLLAPALAQVGIGSGRVGNGGRGGLPAWVGPAILGGAAVVGLGLFLLSRRR
jgi:lysophospholipase L1-like esterase